jgi:hypothetical protein
MLLIRETVQVTVAPPPFPDPLHWSTVTGSAEVCVDGSTEHRTRMVPPPPLPELLHWVTVAPVVLPSGVHSVVGAVPPPCPDTLHWFTVAGVGVTTPVMLLTTATLQVTVPPPPLPEPSHWVTEVMSGVADVVVVTQVGGAPAAPLHSVTVRVELVTPVARSRLLVTVTEQATACPPTLSVPLHWLTAGGVMSGEAIAGEIGRPAANAAPGSGAEGAGTPARVLAVGVTAEAWL